MLIKFNRFFVLALVIIMFTKCSTESIDPKADFSFQGQTTSNFALATYDECLLVNLSPNIEAVHWDFGNGKTSTDHDVKLSYEKSGTYEVTLTVTHQDGVQSTVKKSVVVKDRLLKSIDISKVYWELENTNGWPSTPQASIYLKIQEYTETDMTAGYLCTTCPVVYTSSLIDNVSHNTLTSLLIPVNEKVVIDKKLIQFAIPENLNKAYLVSLMARDKDGNEYCLQSNRGGGSYFGILRENFTANEFIVQNGPFSDYTLKCNFE